MQPISKTSQLSTRITQNSQMYRDKFLSFMNTPHHQQITKNLDAGQSDAKHLAKVVP